MLQPAFAANDGIRLCMQKRSCKHAQRFVRPPRRTINIASNESIQDATTLSSNSCGRCQHNRNSLQVLTALTSGQTVTAIRPFAYISADSFAIEDSPIALRYISSSWRTSTTAQLCRYRRSSLRASHVLTMCFHQYTHYNDCKAAVKHVPMHTHLCEKNVTEDETRVIFCENYDTVRVNAPGPCPFCPARSLASQTQGAQGTDREASLKARAASYPSPPNTATPQSPGENMAGSSKRDSWCAVTMNAQTSLESCSVCRRGCGYITEIKRMLA